MLALTAADLSRCQLYGILDLGYVDPPEMCGVAEQMIDGGIDLIQLRAKNRPISEIRTAATELHSLTEKRSVPLIINDHAEIARAASAEGAHVGQEDPAIRDVREIVGAERMVGKSTHTVDQAIRAFYEGADYIGFGPIFATPTKPDYPPIGLEEIRRVHEAVRIPIFCIGGITLGNLPEVLSAGARRVVIVSGLLLANDITSYARSAKKLLSLPTTRE